MAVGDDDEEEDEDDDDTSAAEVVEASNDAEEVEASCNLCKLHVGEPRTGFALALTLHTEMK